MNVEFYQDTDEKWRFRVKGGNGEIVASSEGYASESNAKRGAETLFQLLQPEAKPAEEDKLVRKATEEVELTDAERDERTEDLLDAAWCYLSAARDGNGFDLRMSPMAWPWDRRFWKPGTRNENMAKALRFLIIAKKLYNERTTDG